MKNHRPSALALPEIRHRLYTRRQLLLAAAGGSLASLFPLSGFSAAQAEEDPWNVIEQVQQHLFPDEPDAPGARAVNALAYLQQVMRDPRIHRTSAISYCAVSAGCRVWRNSAMAAVFCR